MIFPWLFGSGKKDPEPQPVLVCRLCHVPMQRIGKGLFFAQTYFCGNPGCTRYGDLTVGGIATQ